MAYTNCSTRLVINRNPAKKIPVLSSVQQGLLLSPLLLSLYLEPLCLSVCAVPLHGFKLHSAEVKRLAYADGVGIVVADMQNMY